MAVNNLFRFFKSKLVTKCVTVIYLKVHNRWKTFGFFVANKKTRTSSSVRTDSWRKRLI